MVSIITMNAKKVRLVVSSLSSVLLIALFASSVMGSSNPYPNELPGFKFYSKYLYPLCPLKSMRSQVVKVLGSDDLVEVGQWEIAPAFIVEKTPPSKSVEVNRLGSIVIRPKERLSMLGIKFPPAFTHHLAEITEAEGGAFDVYRDRFGLAYWIRSGNTIAGENGDLLQVEYGPPR